MLSTLMRPIVSIAIKCCVIHPFVSKNEFLEAAAGTMNRTLFSLENFFAVRDFQRDGQSKVSRSSGENMSVRPRSISSTWGELIWEIIRGIIERLFGPANRKFRVRRSVQWEIVGKRLFSVDTVLGGLGV
jgi:hypothetical protein